MARLLWFLVAVMLLAACVPEPKALPRVEEGQPPASKEALPPVIERTIPPVYTQVWQLRGKERILWGYDQQGKLVLLNSSAAAIVLDRDRDGRLVRIDDGIKPMTFFYDDKGKLLSAEKGITRWIFAYTSKGRLLSMENDEKLTITHDSKGRLSSVARDSGPTTEFAYDGQNRTKSMYKGRIETSMFYDTDGRLARLDREDDHLVIGYWREDLLSSLSGTMYGLKETVNYGPGAITLLSNVEQNVFESEHIEDAKARLDAFDTFLFCTRFRKLPVLFDGQSWVLYHEYFKGNITDYVLTGFICDVLP
jgi:hypothetical protein